MSDKDPSWPTYFPKSCPPSDAEETSGEVVYRYVSDEDLEGDDFLPHKLIFAHILNWGEKECDACGLSVFRSLDDLLSPSVRLPAIKKLRQKYQYIAKGVLEPGLGAIKPTPSKQTGSAHNTVWLYAGTEPKRLCALFREVIPSAVE